MIRHVVLFKFKAEVDAPQRQAMAEGLAGLPAKIPQIRSWSQGTNVVEAARNYDFCLVGDFETAADLETYQVHPEHQQVVQTLIRPIVESIVVVDFEA